MKNWYKNTDVLQPVWIRKDKEMTHSPLSNDFLDNNAYKKENLQCQFCFKEFSFFSHLQRHIRTHTGERPFVCSICSKAFTQQVDLIRHCRIHTGERPFKCSLCDYSAVQASHLANHMKRKH